MNSHSKFDKKLLIKDMSARLPYGVIGRVYVNVLTKEYSLESGHYLDEDIPVEVTLEGIDLYNDTITVNCTEKCKRLSDTLMEQHEAEPYVIEDFTPYLRPLSDMTERERKQYEKLTTVYQIEVNGKWFDMPDFNTLEWLIKHHFDYQGLIEKGLALKAQDNMYKHFGDMDTTISVSYKGNKL